MNRRDPTRRGRSLAPGDMHDAHAFRTELRLLTVSEAIASEAAAVRRAPIDPLPVVPEAIVGRSRH